MNFEKITRTRAYGYMSSLIGKIGEHDLLTLAGALAFNTALSLGPLVLIFLTVAGLLGNTKQDQLIRQVQEFLGTQAADGFKLVIENAKSRPTLGSIAGIIGVVMLLVSASSVFAQLQSSLNVIWETDPTQTAGLWGWLRKRILSMGMVLAIGFIAAVSLILSSLLTFVASDQSAFLHFLNLLVSVLVFSLLFALMFDFLPDERIPYKSAAVGGFITAVLFTVGKFAIGAYLGQSAISSSYGAAGSIIVLLTWVYYSAFIFFVGAEITRSLSPAAQKSTFEKSRSRDPRPQDFKPAHSVIPSGASWLPER